MPYLGDAKIYVGAGLVWEPAGGATPVTATEAFTGSDGADLSGATLDTGGFTWTVDRGAWSIQTNQGRATGTVSPSALMTFNPGVSDFDYTVKVTPGATTVDGLLLRYTDTSNYWRIDLQDTSNRVTLSKAVAGSETAFNSATFTVATGVQYTVRVVAYGSLLVVLVDGVHRISIVDTQWSTVTKVGLITASTSARFDDLSFTEIIT